MVCIHCSGKTQVTNSRPQKRLNQVWRRRECLECSAIFTTEESADLSAAWMVRRKTSALEPFQRDKLFLSIHNSVQHRPTALTDATSLTNTVIQKLLANNSGATIDASLITQIVQVALTRFDSAASVHYAAFHQN